MSPRRTIFTSGSEFKRKQFIQKTLLILVLLVIVAMIPVFYFKLRGSGTNEKLELRNSFEKGDFETAYNQSREMLKEKPLDFYLLTIHGFSAYQLAIAQINNFDTLSYINDCVWSLRKAMLSKGNSKDGGVNYVLGKAYYYKGSGYADLAITYLEKAKSLAYKATDIPEYLGLSYAAIRDYRSSVEAFSLALNGYEQSSGNDQAKNADAQPSDILLLSIAKSYLALNEYDSARAYLVRCLDITKDSRTTVTARLLLGGILVKMGDTSGAEAEFQKVITENGENAEAHYQLGELYASGGDMTRARSEWRRALRIDPAHALARSRLNIQ